MVQIGIKEFKTHVSKLVRSVEEDGQTIEITRRGTVVARLEPAPQVSEEERARRWAKLEQLSEEIGKLSPSKISAVDVIHDVRREL